MMGEIVLATKNRGKIEEFTSLLRGVFQKIMTLTDLDSAPNIVEDGNTYRENALKKARSISEFTQKLTIGDDSGLEVETLGGRPGILSSRYAGENARDKENINKLLRELSGLSNRKARFVCSLALVSPHGEEIVVEGTCEGIIIDGPRGEGGFGYDPVFFIPEINKTFAELSFEEKNQISHRAHAVKALIEGINGPDIYKQ
jgi:XTP/dITP diphosphohydrolase